MSDSSATFLEPVVTISPPDWMTAPETRAVMEALNIKCGIAPDTPYFSAALFVGGCVRNALMKRPVADIDIATKYKPQTVVELLETAGIKAIPTGLAHGTVTAVVEGKSFEITTLREDIETDGRHAVVSFTANWVADARRRDFTMNTLLADMDGQVYDPLERGYDDLQKRKIIFVGDPSARIAEDYLRILRFFRFYAGYGEGDPDQAALAACRAAADKIKTLSKERITQEFLKLLSYDSPQGALDLMFENNVLPDLPAAGYDGAVMEALCRMQKDEDAFSLAARLVALAAFRSSHLKAMQAYLMLSKAQLYEFETIIEAVGALDDVSEGEVKRLIYRYSNDITLQAVLLFLSWEELENPAAVSLAKTWQAPVFPLSGDDVVAVGVLQGPAVGKILTQIESWWLEQGMTPDREACLEMLKNLAAGAVE